MFSSRNTPTIFDDLSFHGIPVKKVGETKHLGLILHNKLLFESHLDKKIKKAKQGVGLMKQIYPHVPLFTLEIYIKCIYELTLITVILYSTYPTETTLHFYLNQTTNPCTFLCKGLKQSNMMLLFQPPVPGKGNLDRNIMIIWAGNHLLILEENLDASVCSMKSSPQETVVMVLRNHFSLPVPKKWKPDTDSWIQSRAEIVY